MVENDGTRLLIHKSTMIVKNNQQIDEVYRREAAVSLQRSSLLTIMTIWRGAVTGQGNFWRCVRSHSHRDRTATSHKANRKEQDSQLGTLPD